MNELLQSPHARWIVPVLLGMFSCICACAVMFCLWTTVIMPADTGGAVGVQEGFMQGFEAGRDATPFQSLYALSMFCVPPVLMVIVGVGSYFLMRAFQSSREPARERDESS